VRRLGEEAFDGFFMRTSKTKKTRGAGSAAAGRADGENIPGNIPAGNTGTNTSIAPGTSPEVVTIHRRQINAAPYNPRKIGEKNRGKLRKGMLEFGMVELEQAVRQPGRRPPTAFDPGRGERQRLHAAG
jgi:hypothetical protein